MNFRQLEYIQRIAKEGSISKVAAKLYISQSALSQQLLKLEEEIGAPIFERGINPLRPTHLGEQYLEYVEKILFEYEQANRLLEDLEHSKKNRLTIGIPMNRSNQILPHFIPSFLRDYPNIELIFHEHPSFRLDEMLLAGEIDFSMMISASEAPQLTFLPLIRDEIYLACQSGCPLDQKLQKTGRLEDPGELEKENFILMKKGYRLHNEALRLFEASDIHPNIILETGNVDLSRRLASMGTGACLVSRLAHELNPMVPEPSCYSIGKDGLFWTLGVCYHKGKYISWAMKLFFDRMRECLKEHFPDAVL